MYKRLFALIILLITAGMLFSTITVTSPNGGETWTPGYTYNVTWTSSGVTGNVKIELYRFTGMGNLVATINNSISVTAGTFSWTVPLNLVTAAASNYYVLITSLTNPSDYDMSNNLFTITAPPTLTVTSPNGGEVWNIGSTYPITWTSTDLSGIVAIRLVNFSNGGMVTLATVSVPTGVYNWTIGSSTLTGTAYRIRVVSIQVPAIADSSDSYFTINPPVGLTIISPNGGEVWRPGSTYPIQWSSVGVTGSAKLELFRGTNTTPTSTIVTSTIVSNGIQMWVIPTTIPLGNDYKVKITHNTNPAYFDYSDNYFSIDIPPANDDQMVSPLVTGLKSNSPNPFTQATEILYELKNSQSVTLKIYNSKGQLIRALVNDIRSAGSHSVQWDGKDNSGNLMPGGVYLCRMQAGDITDNHRLLLIK